MVGPYDVPVYGISAWAIVITIALIGWIAGMLWIRRIFWNPDDEPKSWRYHDHD